MTYHRATARSRVTAFASQELFGGVVIFGGGKEFIESRFETLGIEIPFDCTVMAQGDDAGFLAYDNYNGVCFFA